MNYIFPSRVNWGSIEFPISYRWSNTASTKAPSDYHFLDWSWRSYFLQLLFICLGAWVFDGSLLLLWTEWHWDCAVDMLSLFLSNELLEYYQTRKEFNFNIWVVLMDFVKAFDTMNWYMLMKILAWFSLQEHLINVIRCLYKPVRMKFKSNKQIH